MLLDLGGVDYLEREPRFDVVYHLLNLHRKSRASPRSASRRACASCAASTAIRRICRRSSICGSPPIGPSAKSSISSASSSTGTPICAASRCRYDWEGHPLRKGLSRCADRRANARRDRRSPKNNVPPARRLRVARSKRCKIKSSAFARATESDDVGAAAYAGDRQATRATRWCSRWGRSIRRRTACCR